MADSKDDFDNDLLQDESNETTAPVAPVEPAAPSTPTHSPLAIQMARELGIDGFESMTPDALNATITTVRRLQGRQAQPTPPPEVEADEPVDWGRNPDGTPRTEAQYREATGLDDEIIAIKKLAHTTAIENKKLRKQQESIQQKLAQEQAERTNRQILQKIHRVMKERPDLYGEKPGQADPGTPEAAKYQMTMAHLSSLVQNKQHSTPEKDTRAAMELFGNAAPVQRNVNPAVAAYQRAEMARPTSRKTPDHRTPRQIREEQVAARQAEANGYVGSGDDDDADLLDA